MNHIPSPDTSDAGIERLIQAKGKTAPRVTPADIAANIASTWFFTGADGANGAAVSGTSVENQPPLPSNHPLSLITFCVLVLKNGFTVTGESACASPENFDAQIGREMSRQNAVQKIWPLLGFALKERLHAEPDFLAGSKACDLTGDGTCEACQ